MPNTHRQSGVRPRTPGILYAGIALVLIALVGIVSLTASQPPPPTIAEFAPQAQERIEEAPIEQTSDFGSGEGSIGGGEAAPTPTPPSATPAPAPKVEVARVHRCVGEPPRQIEDPQSPPCVPYWEGDNDGSTWQGVTENEIKIAVARSDPMPDGLVEALVAFFNKRFEFYGRRLTFEYFQPTGEGTPSEQQADAVTVDEEINAFAAAEYGVDFARGGQTTFYDALASREIPSVSYTTNYTNEGHVQRRAPYEWQHYPEFHLNQRHAGGFICRGLSERAARYAGPGVEGQQRRFGILGEQASDGTTYPDVSTLETALDECGADLGAAINIAGFDAAESKNALLRMQTEGVTTIVCYCNPGSLGYIHMSNANSQGYFPEWVLADYMNTNSDWFAQSTWPKEQGTHAFGITFGNKYLDAADMPWNWAINEVAPGYDGPYDWSHYYYEVFLQLASGIQMAGPHLTPQSFRDGMMGTPFPNPNANRAPYYQSKVDYSTGDPWQQKTGTVIWWNQTEVSPVTGYPGAFCYANGGRRYTLGTWPTDDAALFSGSCR